MSADSLMEEFGLAQGWDDTSKLGICLSYINAQQNDDTFKDHLLECVADETDENEAAEEQHFIDLLDNEHDEDDEYECSECGGKLRNFLHTCVGQKELTPVFGCPVCDDRCGFCG